MADNDLRQALANALRDWRVRNGFTQQEAARQLRVSYRSYQKYEEASALPHLPRLHAVLEKIDATHLIGGGDDGRVSEAMQEMAAEIRRLREDLEVQRRDS